MGKAEYCEIVINDPTVEDVHCSLLCTVSGVWVTEIGRTGKTDINRAVMGRGETLLSEHDVIRIGGTLLIACGDGADQRPYMVVRDVYETVQTAPDYHASKHQAAEALNVKPTTYYRWLDTHKFKSAAIVATMVIGIGWMSFGSGGDGESSSNSTRLPAAGIPAPSSPAAMPSASAPSLDVSGDRVDDGPATESPSSGLEEMPERAVQAEPAIDKRPEDLDEGEGGKESKRARAVKAKPKARHRARKRAASVEVVDKDQDEDEDKGEVMDKNEAEDEETPAKVSEPREGVYTQSPPRSRVYTQPPLEGEP